MTLPHKNNDRAAIKAAFVEILGSGSVYDSEIVSHAQIACSVYPNTQLELSRAIALAAKNHWQILTSNLNWGRLVKFDRPGIMINTSRLHRLIDHAVGDLTVTCEAGIKFSDLQNTLAKSGQFLAIDPAYAETVTIGEIVNTANTGSLRHRYGGVRDMLLGISFVRADGELVKAGGRVVKNVAGYDLMKLMTGSYGSLGVVSQVSFRLYPLPQCDRTIIIIGQAQKIDILRAKILISNLTPWAMDILSTGILSKLLSKLEITSELGIMIRFGGLTQGVEEQIRRLFLLTQELDLDITIKDHHIWEEIQHLIWENHISPVVSMPIICPIICKVGTLSNIAIDNLLRVSSQLTAFVQIHAGSGLGILRYEGSNYGEIQAEIIKVRNLLENTGGFLTVLVAPSEFKNAMTGEGYGNAQGIMTALKQKFDPHNLLNPHGFIE